MATYSGSTGAAHVWPQSLWRSCLEIAIAPAAVRLARQWTADQLAGTDPPPSIDAIDSAVLMVSELVTNAIQAVHRAVTTTVRPAFVAGIPNAPHLQAAPQPAAFRPPGPMAPAPRVWMTLTRIEELVRIEVHDSSCAPLPGQLPGNDDEAEGGRGLMVVAALAASWGWRPDALGKVVWCDLLS